MHQWKWIYVQQLTSADSIVDARVDQHSNLYLQKLRHGSCLVLSQDQEAIPAVVVGVGSVGENGRSPAHVTLRVKGELIRR